MSRAIFVRTVRRDAGDNSLFSITRLLPHTPVSIPGGMGGWDGTGAGLSDVDLDEILKHLKDTSSNIHEIKIILLDVEDV